MALIPPAPDHSGADPYRDGFEEARRDLLMGDSPGERATAAQKLGLLGNTAGVAYLIAALYDNAAKVRNAAAESLGQIGDASALGPLIDLQQREGSNAAISNAISLISSREKNLVSANGESAEFKALESTSEEAATVNEPTQLLTAARDGKDFFTDAIAEINNLFHAAAEQTERIDDARCQDTVNNPQANVVESQLQPRQPSAATTISDEIGAGFELLRQAEARQSELIAEAEARLHEQQEARQKIEVIVGQRAEQEKRLAAEIEALHVTEQELRQRLQEAEECRRLQCEVVRKGEEEIRARAEEENLLLAELEEQRHNAEEESRKRAEQKQELESNIARLNHTVSEQNDRIAEAEARIAETLRTLKADEQRHVAEAQAALKSQKKMRKQAAAKVKQCEKQIRRLNEEIEALQNDAEEQAKKIAASEAEFARAQEAALAQSEAEACLREEFARLQEAEAQTGWALEVTERAVAKLRSQVGAEECRLAELTEIKQQAEAEAQQRSAREAEMKRQLKRLEQTEQQQGKRLQKAEISLQAKQETLNQIEAELQRLAAEEALRDCQIASLRETLQQLETESRERTREEELRISEIAELRCKTEAELSQRQEFKQQLTAELETLRVTYQNQLKAISELEASVQEAHDKAQQRTAMEADLKRQLNGFADYEQELAKQLQTTGTALQSQLQKCNQLEAECQQRAAAEELHLAKLAAIREQAAEEGQRRAAQEAKLNGELQALSATGQNQLRAISELEASLQQAQVEAQQHSAQESGLKQELSRLAKDAQKLRKRLQATETSLQCQQKTHQKLEIECQQRTEAEAEQLARLAATREQLAEEGRQRAVLEQQLSDELAALRAAEANQLRVIKKLEENVQQTRTEAEQLTSREVQLNAEIQTLQATLAAQHASQTAVAARRAEQENSLREMDDAARLQAEEEAVRLGQLGALRHQLESESQQRLADERQLNFDIEALRLEETEHRARLEQLRNHAATLEEAKQLRVLEESNISAEIAALEASISRAEEPRANASEFVPEIAVFKVIDDEEAADAEPSIVSSDSSSFELHSPKAIHEEEVVIGNADFEMPAVNVDQIKLTDLEPVSAPVEVDDQAKSLSLVTGETGLTQINQDSPLSQAAKRLGSTDPSERCKALMDLSKLGGEESFDLITNRFDDASLQVRNAAARALCELNPDRAASLTRALREAEPERRRRIGAAFAGSGLATQAINCLAGEGREVTYDAFTVLFLMAKAGEVQPLIDTIESHANIAVRLAVIKLLAFSNQSDVVAAFRRLAVRASLPAEVRSAVMEAIHDITSPSRESRISAA